MSYQQTNNDCKFFVGNLSWKTDSGMLGEYFSKFGPVTDAVVITDRGTGRSRGFGFVTFQDPRSKDEALNIDEGRHQIDNRTAPLKGNGARYRADDVKENGMQLHLTKHAKEQHFDKCTELKRVNARPCNN